MLFLVKVLCLTWSIAYIQKALAICTVLNKMAKGLAHYCFWNKLVKNTSPLFTDAA